MVSALLWSRFVENHRLQRGLHAANRELAALATEDPLTGLLNRRAFLRAAERDRALAARTGAPLSVVMLDLDHFKAINDRYGHAVGDEVLRATAAALTGASRKTDRVARLGGEEFVLWLPDTPAAGAALLADKVRARLAEIAVPGFDGRLTASAGVAAFTGESLTDLLRRADAALYRAKDLGRNRTAVSE